MEDVSVAALTAGIASAAIRRGTPIAFAAMGESVPLNAPE